MERPALLFLFQSGEGLLSHVLADALAPKLGSDRPEPRQPPTGSISHQLGGEPAVIDQIGLLQVVQGHLHVQFVEPCAQETPAKLSSASPPDRQEAKGAVLRRAG
jgi:hypothetical protein